MLKEQAVLANPRKLSNALAELHWLRKVLKCVSGSRFGPLVPPRSSLSGHSKAGYGLGSATPPHPYTRPSGVRRQRVRDDALLGRSCLDASLPRRPTPHSDLLAGTAQMWVSRRSAAAKSLINGAEFDILDIFRCGPQPTSVEDLELPLCHNGTRSESAVIHLFVVRS